MITVINGNATCLPIRNNSISLIITSPPYNCGMSYQTHNDNMVEEDYFDMLQRVWVECCRVLVPGGRICVNIAHGIGRNPYVPVGSYISIQLHQEFEMLGTIIWDKGLRKLCSWGSFLRPSSPSIRDSTELILVAKKPGDFVVPFIGPSPLLDTETFLELTRDLWVMQPTTQARSGHPAAFPVSLPERLIRLYAYPGAVVLDPFAGSGTTGQAAKNLGLSAVLVDIDKSYCELMQSNLLKQPDLFREIA